MQLWSYRRVIIIDLLCSDVNSMMADKSDAFRRQSDMWKQNASEILRGSLSTEFEGSSLRPNGTKHF
jgi:malate synthase